MTAAAAAILFSSLAMAKAPPRAPEKPAPANRIDVQIVEEGQLAELRAEGAKLTLRTSTGGARERTLGDDERARLSQAARAALAADDVRRSCGGVGETFVTVTVDGKTLFNAVCAASKDDVALAWRRLVDVARALAAR